METNWLNEGRDRTREMVRRRDGYKCQKCGKKWKRGKRRLDVHHLNGLCGKLTYSYDKAIDINKLITLCHSCHLNLPEVRRKMTLIGRRENQVNRG